MQFTAEDEVVCTFSTLQIIRKTEARSYSEKMATTLMMEAGSFSEIQVNTLQIKVADSFETLVTTLKLEAEIYFSVR
jgi:hypothetical protein